MSIKTQKILRFIPFVGFLLVAIQWILFYHRNVVPNKVKRIFCDILITAAAFLILMIPEIILDYLFDYALLETIINLMVSFAGMYIFSSVLIFDQEKYYKKIQK